MKVVPRSACIKQMTEGGKYMLDEKLNIICKSCGGTFEGLENTTYGKCPYCGSEIFVNYISKKIIWKKRTMFYQFKKMDDINSEKYIRYRYKEEVSNKMLEYVILEIVILAFIMIFLKWKME